MIRKVAIVVYETGDDFMVKGEVDIRDPGALLKRAKREARRRGIEYVKNLDNKPGLGRK
jgi:hypothetical protein